MTVHRFRRTTKAAAALAFAAGAMATVGATSAHAAETWEGCPAGAVCIYPEGAGFDGTGDYQGFMGPQTYVDKDLTPINSIVLVP